MTAKERLAELNTAWAASRQANTMANVERTMAAEHAIKHHAAQDIAALQEALDQAHAHIGALLSEGCDDATRDAAQAWLRRK